MVPWPRMPREDDGASAPWRFTPQETRGLLGSTSISQRTRERKMNRLRSLFDISDVVCLRESPAHRLAFDGSLYSKLNAEGCAVMVRKTLLSGAQMQHIVTHEERDRLMVITSPQAHLVFISVHHN